MLGFGDFEAKKKFVCLKLDAASVYNIQEWCGGRFDQTVGHDGNKVDEFCFHVTLFYSSNGSNIPVGEHNIPKIPLVFSDIALFGENNNIPVLKLVATPELLKYRRIFEALGLQDTWPEWKPHVTVSYNFNGNFKEIENLPMPVKPIYVNKLIIEDQS